MATRAKKISVTVTAGENTPVNHVVRIEDLLQKMQQPARAKKGAAKAARAAAPGPAQQLVAELEAQLRALRKRQP
ncbi:hypothetical protein ACPOLB_22640 [Rubrivivax sp. RP6-9]|uniref:hypothetical protein n=1 Tax=Rubrivivax sp. RP6-9 TaxID=3415750 RepID=UPI003CC63E5A